MNTEQKNEAVVEKPTLAQLWQDIKKHKRLYYKVLGITFVVSAIIALSIPNYYKCTVMLAPEMTGGKSTSALASLASNFGVNLNSGNIGADALMPNLYPDLMNSVAFRASLFPVMVQRKDENITMTYYNYLLNEQRLPWWSAAGKYLIATISSLLGKEEYSSDVNPFELTKEQYNVIKEMEKKVICDVDQKTFVISIDVIDQDPLIAATLADSVQKRLQDFITNYRTRKARVDLEYNQKLFKEAKERYESARVKYANYADANRNVLFENSRSERTKLENELQLQYQSYSRVAAQLQMAEAKVQEDTPAFTTLQPATVPVKKAGPQRALICILFMFLTIIFLTLYVFNKEGDFLPLFRAPQEGSNSNLNEFIKILSLEDLKK